MLADLFETVIWCIVLGGVVALGFVIVGFTAGGRKPKSIEGAPYVCAHPSTEFTPSTGQTRCRTCGELLSQDMPQSS